MNLDLINKYFKEYLEESIYFKNYDVQDPVSINESNNKKQFSYINYKRYSDELLNNFKGGLIILDHRLKPQINKLQEKIDFDIVYTINPRLLFIKVSLELKSEINLEKKILIGNNTLIDRSVKLIGPIEIGDNCVIKANANIGNEGFGYEFDHIKNDFLKTPHYKGVKISNNVHIGSSTCIDKGIFQDTFIGESVKIDNLVHIAHNVQIFDNCLIIAGSVICGSSILSKNVYVGPSSTINDNIFIAEGCFIGSGSVVTKNLKEKNLKVFGVPARELRNFIKKK